VQRIVAIVKLCLLNNLTYLFTYLLLVIASDYPNFICLTLRRLDEHLIITEIHNYMQAYL